MKLKTNNILLTVISINIVLLVVFATFFLRDAAEANEEVDLPKCVPHDVEIASVEKDSAVIKWQTNGECISYLQYNEYGSETARIDGENWKPSDTHETNVKGLDSGQVYLFYIVSDGKLFDNSGDPIVVETKPF